MPTVMTNAERAPEAAGVGSAAVAAGKDDNYGPRWSDEDASHDSLSKPRTKSEKTSASSSGGGKGGQHDLHGATSRAKRDTGGHSGPTGGYADVSEEGERGCNLTGSRHDLDVDPDHLLLRNCTI